MAERRRVTGAEPQDLAFYTPGILETVLPDVWDYEDWYGESSTGLVRSGGGNPAEGNTRLAVLVDVSSAVWGLPVEDIEFLSLRYNEHLDWDRIGLRYELTEDGARKRHARILKRLVKALGGEPPWFDGPGSRKARSNAAAQAEVRT